MKRVRYKSNSQEFEPGSQNRRQHKKNATDGLRGGQRSLCSYILYAGRRNGDHYREDKGYGEDHTVRGTITPCGRYGKRKRVRDEVIEAQCRGVLPVINHPSSQDGLQDRAVEVTRKGPVLKSLVGGEAHHDRVI